MNTHARNAAHTLIISALLLWLTPAPVSAQSAHQKRVLILGNSIVLSPPKDWLDWFGNWGMAASDIDLDFSHLLIGRLRQYYGAVDYQIVNVAPMEQYPDKYTDANLRDAARFNADIVVFRFGDNVTDTAEARAAFAALYDTLFAYVAPNAQMIVCSSSWYSQPIVDAQMKEICAKHGGRWVDISDMRRTVKYVAYSERVFAVAGVGTHPGDVGHAEIARRIYSAMELGKMYYPLMVR